MIAVLIILAIVFFLYITSYILNKKVEKPDGCPDFTGCGCCANKLCGHSDTTNTKTEVK